MIRIRCARAIVLSLALACTALPAPAAAGDGVNDCIGDCDGCGTVSIDELIIAVSIALGRLPLSQCDAIDGNGDGLVSIDELIRAVVAALDGCPPPMPTATATETATAPPDDTATATPTPADPTATATAEPSATPTDTVEPDATPTVTPTASGSPSALAAAIDGVLVRLSWLPPDPGSGFPEVLVLRRLNAPVDGPDDPEATVVFSGPGDTATDEVAALLPNVPETARRYFYAVYGCNGDASSCERIGSSTTLEPTLVQVLRAGGYVLHFRHASATVCVDRTDLGTAAQTSVPDWWRSCDATCPIPGPITATARQLDSTGPVQAMAIAQAFDDFAIPVGRVLSSEFCRCFTTAELLDLGPPIEQVPGITFFVYDEANRCESTFAHIGEVPALGTNTAIVSHIGFPSSCPPIDNLATGEAAVFRPDGAGSSVFITKVTFDEWATFAEPGPSARDQGATVP
jgi:hypothetical protein